VSLVKQLREDWTVAQLGWVIPLVFIRSGPNSSETCRPSSGASPSVVCRLQREGVSDKAAMNFDDSRSERLILSLQFPTSDFVHMVFHYDGVVEQWSTSPWFDAAIHIVSKKQSKW
jgi:hypothetical protein